MSDNQNRGINDLLKYDTMTTEELEEILRLDAEAPEGQESDMETLLYVMEVLTNRERNNGRTGNTALEAFESFKKNYMPDIEDDVMMPDREEKPKERSLCWLRSLVAAAAVLVIVLLGSATAKAFGLDIWEAVAKWTQETFHFGDWGQTDDGPGTSDDLNYTSLQDALHKGNIMEPLAPAWVPDGYHLEDVTVDQTPLQIVYNALYVNGEKKIKITVRRHLDSDPQYIEQSEDLVETYEVSGITYYIFSNNQRTQAVWITGSFECYIFGDTTIEEMKLMIDSIGKG